VELINGMENVIVLSPFDKCSGIYHQGNYHTCSDLVLSNLTKQIINEEVNNFTPLLERYDNFTSVVYFNKNHENFIRQINLFQSSYLSSRFKIIYESDNYLLYFKLGVGIACSNRLGVNCVKYGDYNIYSIPMSYFRYLGGDHFEKNNNGLIKSQINELNKNIGGPLFLIILQCLYISGWLTNIFIIIKFSRKNLI
jgi:hypothetical protein